MNAIKLYLIHQLEKFGDELVFQAQELEASLQRHHVRTNQIRRVQRQRMVSSSQLRHFLNQAATEERDRQNQNQGTPRPMRFTALKRELEKRRGQALETFKMQLSQDEDGPILEEAALEPESAWLETEIEARLIDLTLAHRRRRDNSQQQEVTD